MMGVIACKVNVLMMGVIVCKVNVLMMALSYVSLMS